MPSATKRVPPLDPQTRAKPPLRVHQVAHHHRSVAERPNGLSAATPCLQRAFAAYPRPGEAGPAVFHGPIACGLALDSPGLPRPTDADEQTTTGSALQVEGSCAPASRTAEKRLFTARNAQPRSSPGERRRQAVCRFSRVRESMVCVLPGCQIEANSAHDGQHGF